MVHQYRNIMAFMYIFAHPYILRRKRRGIEPQGIQKIIFNLIHKAPLAQRLIKEKYKFLFYNAMQKQS